jgi:hypothetical protein
MALSRPPVSGLSPRRGGDLEFAVKRKRGVEARRLRAAEPPRNHATSHACAPRYVGLREPKPTHRSGEQPRTLVSKSHGSASVPETDAMSMAIDSDGDEHLPMGRKGSGPSLLPLTMSKDIVKSVTPIQRMRAERSRKRQAAIVMRIAFAMKMRELGANELDRMMGQGIGQTSRLTTGKRPRPVSYDTLLEYAAALRIRFEWLAEGTGLMEEPANESQGKKEHDSGEMPAVKRLTGRPGPRR